MDLLGTAGTPSWFDLVLASLNVIQVLGLAGFAAWSRKLNGVVEAHRERLDTVEEKLPE